MKVFVGIGSNIDPENSLRACAALLMNDWPAIRFSSVYESAPLERKDQDPFLNAVALIETKMPPREVRQRLKDIERTLKKNPPFRFGPRTIDLDVLLCDGSVLPDEESWRRIRAGKPLPGETLFVPHPRMHERRFVLEPLCELIDETNSHPVLKTAWKELLARVRDQECARSSLHL